MIILLKFTSQIKCETRRFHRVSKLPRFLPTAPARSIEMRSRQAMCIAPAGAALRVAMEGEDIGV